MKPDAATELAAIRQDIRHLADVASRSTSDLKTLRQLQAYLTTWIHRQAEKEDA